MPLYTTEDEPGRAAFDRWRYMVSCSFVPVDAQPTVLDGPRGPFQGQVRCGDLAQVQVALVDSVAHSVRRTPRMIAAGGEDYSQLLLPVAGRTRVEHGDRLEALGPSDLMMIDCERAYQLDFAAAHRVLCFTFPRSLIQLAPEHVSSLAGTKLPVRDGVGALLVPFLLQLAHQTHAEEVRSPARLAGNMIDLLETLLVERSEHLLRMSEAPQRVLLLRIKSDIEARLSSSDLTPHGIAAAHHISTRYLHKLFESQGVTVSQWIKERRLEHCRRDLVDPALRRQTVAAIGARWGLRDAAHFSRLFKASFHTTPRGYRLAHAALEDEPAGLPHDGAATSLG
jgi:AraC-like DNA-binding protein